MSSRIGVGGDLDKYPLAGVGWWHNWWTGTYPGTGYVQTVWEMAQLSDALIAVNKGATWLVGNEPENSQQGNMTPAQYATFYHDVYTYIKARDRTAQVALGAVTSPTPLRLKWLDALLASYRTQYRVSMPIDVLNVHVYILQELRDDWGIGIPVGLTEEWGMLWLPEHHLRVDIFKQFVIAFRTWAWQRGYGNRPLIVSEFGNLLTGWFSNAQTIAYMDATFQSVNAATDWRYGYWGDGRRIVQRWAWFSLNAPNGAGQIYADGQLTSVGKHFAGWLK